MKKLDRNILNIIKENSNELKQSDLAILLSVSRITICRSIRRLKEAGILEININRESGKFAISNYSISFSNINNINTIKAGALDIKLKHFIELRKQKEELKTAHRVSYASCHIYNIKYNTKYNTKYNIKYNTNIKIKTLELDHNNSISIINNIIYIDQKAIINNYFINTIKIGTNLYKKAIFHIDNIYNCFSQIYNSIIKTISQAQKRAIASYFILDISRINLNKSPP